MSDVQRKSARLARPMLLMVAAALVAACGSNPASTTGSGQNKSGVTAPAMKKVKAAVAVAELATSVGPYSSLPKFLGYWQEEGLDVDVVGIAGSNVAMQMILSKELDYAFPGTPSHLATVAQSPDVTAIYSLFPHNQYRIATLAESTVRNLKDLKGKKIGVAALSSAAVVYAKAVLKAEGVNEQDVEFLPLGNSVAQYANALKQKTVDAMAGFDNNAGGLEAAGLNLRILESPMDPKITSGQVIAARKDTVKSDPKTAIGIARGIAKATLFAQTNPEAAVRIHWKVYPESKPSGIAEDVAMKQGLAELKARLETMRIDNTAEKLWGNAPEAGFQFLQQWLFDNQQIKKVTPYAQAFDNSLIAQINQFDQAAIQQQAKTYKLP